MESNTISYMKNIKLYDFDSSKLYSTFKSNFITENSKDIDFQSYLYASSSINRSEYIIKLAKLLYDFQIAISIENGIYEYSLIHASLKNIEKNFIPAIYDDKFIDIYMNLDPNSRLHNKSLITLIDNGNINPQLFAFLSPQQIHPESWAPILNKAKYKENTEKNMATTDWYQCNKCGENKAKVSELQLRSADEPSTIFITCLVCYNTDLK